MHLKMIGEVIFYETGTEDRKYIMSLLMKEYFCNIQIATIFRVFIDKNCDKALQVFIFSSVSNCIQVR